MVDRTERPPAALERVRDSIRRQGAEARRLRRLRRAAPLAALAAFAAGAALAGALVERAAAARPELFAVRTLAVAGAQRLDAEALARAAGGGEGGPAAVAARLARHPWVAEARATRVAPDTVVARVVERVPVAVLVQPEADALLVDGEGVPFAPAAEESAGLPRLVVASPVEPGRPSLRVAAALALARRVQEAGWTRFELDLDGPDPRARPALRVSGLAPRVVLGQGDAQDQLQRLARVLAERPESRRVAEIDLRFADQVVLRPASEANEPAPTAPPTRGRTG